MIHHTVTTAIAGSAQVSLVDGIEAVQADQRRGRRPAARGPAGSTRRQISVTMVTDSTDEPKNTARSTALRRSVSFSASARNRPSPTKAGVVISTKTNGVAHRCRKIVSSKQIAEIVEPDAARLAAQHVVVLEAQPDAEAERHHQQHQEHDEIGQHEQHVGERRPTTPTAAQAPRAASSRRAQPRRRSLAASVQRGRLVGLPAASNRCDEAAGGRRARLGSPTPTARRRSSS